MGRAIFMVIFISQKNNENLLNGYYLKIESTDAPWGERYFH